MSFTPNLENIRERCEKEATRTVPPNNFPHLPRIPAGRYISEEFEALENKYLWRRNWLCAGRESDLPEQGSYRLFRKLGPTIVLVRGKDNCIRAFYNTCRHRGAPIVRDESGRTNLLRCQFHSWSYSLDGKLIGVPDEGDFTCFDRNENSLISVRCEVWDGWIFINLDNNALALHKELGTLPQQLESLGMSDLRVIDKRSYIVQCNWKTTVDAFLEVYHLKTIHPETANAALDHKLSTIELLQGGHAWNAVGRREALSNTIGDKTGKPDIPSLAEVFRQYGFTYSLFPNIVAPIDPVGFPWLVIWPQGIKQCEIEVYFIGPDWGGGPQPTFYEQYFAFFEKLVGEDIKNLAPIQESLESGAYTGSLVNYQERRIYWFNEEIDRRIGVERIPSGMRVSQVLTPETEYID